MQTLFLSLLLRPALMGTNGTNNPELIGGSHYFFYSDVRSFGKEL